jgi:hypothetical protein
MPLIESVLGKKKAELRSAETWLDERFSAGKNAYGMSAWTPSAHLAHLWAVERYCGLTHKEKLGAHDWYREGAEYLVAEQGADGNWRHSVEEVCFALLFLRRATVTGYEDLSALYAELDREKRAEEEKPLVQPAADVPRITDWLVAGPFLDKRGAPVFLKPPFAPEKLVPREKQQLRERVFERWTLKPDSWTNLEELTGRGGDFLLWVLSTNLIYKPPSGSDRTYAGNEKTPRANAKSSSDGDRQPLDLILWFAFEDAWKVYLDGKLVSSDERVQSAIYESVRVDLRLEPGVHTLVVLVSDDVGASAFSARLTDALGHRLPASVVACADPTGKPKPPEKNERSDKKK